jgi:two-component system, LuxR family, response regulator FixJ
MMRSIYIIDDDEELRISLHRLLSLRSDLLIRSFASGDAFLDQRDELDPGELLLDMNMPGSSGLDVLRAIKDQPRFLAIVLTGQGSIEVATKAMKAGAFDFLEKPYDYQALTDVMEGAFEKLEQESAAAARVENARARIGQLSARERDVLRGLIEGHANKVIAHELAISPRTVEIYRANLMAKLKVRSLSEALKIAFAAGLLPDE